MKDSNNVTTEITLVKLERDFYAVKRRVDLLITTIDFKQDGHRLSEEWDTILTLSYNSIDEIEILPYLISKKTFPDSHYHAFEGTRITLQKFKQMMVDVAEKLSDLYDSALKLNGARENDPHVLESLNPEVDWENWLEILEKSNEEIQVVVGEYCK